MNEWQGADGFLQEKKIPRTVSKDDKKRDMDGYLPSAAEKRQTPRKVVDLQSTYGQISAGVDAQNQIVLLTRQKQTKHLHSLPLQSKCLSSSRAVRVPRQQGSFRVNSDNKTQSAVEYREQTGQSYAFLWKRLHKMMRQTENRVQDAILGFADNRTERHAAAALRRLRTQTPLSQRGALETQIAHFDAQAVQKEQQKRRFLQRLDTMTKESKAYAAMPHIEEKRKSIEQTTDTEPLPPEDSGTDVKNLASAADTEQALPPADEKPKKTKKI